MDISTEIAAIQAASQGSELRQPLVGALNKLNSGSLPAVTVSDVGKILKVGANGWEVGEKSGYMPVPSASLNISSNGTHDVTNYAEAVVNVQPSGKITITQNGTDIDVANYALADVAISGGATLVQKTITQNGTYDPADDNADGYSEVTVNVNSGGYPPINAIVNGQIGVFQIEGIAINENISAYGSYLETNSASVIKFMQNYARIKFGNTKGTGGTSSSYGTIAERVALTSAMLNSVQDFVSEFPVLWSAEYVGNVYGNTSMISDLGLVLLGDFSAGGLASGNQLLDSIDNYSAVLLNGIYQKNPNANYNTSMMYPNPNLNQAYWTGMKDRNSSYNCNVTFTDETHVSLSGNKQVIIYGIP